MPSTVSNGNESGSALSNFSLVDFVPFVFKLFPANNLGNGINDRKMSCMKKWDYQLLVQLWDTQRQRFYWADNETDLRSPQERLELLAQDGWEVVSSFPCGATDTQQNYLLRRAGQDGKDGSDLPSPFGRN